MLRKIDTGFDSGDSDEEEQQEQLVCNHGARNTLCAHCQMKFCNQCEFLHKFRIKKEMETMLSSCEKKLKTLQTTDSGTINAKTKASLEKANQELRDQLNCRVAQILQMIMTTNRRERYRIQADARKLTEDRAAPYLAVLNEAKSASFDKMKPAELDSWVAKLEQLISKVDDRRFSDEFKLYENTANDEVIRRFLTTKPIFKLEKTTLESEMAPVKSTSTTSSVSDFDSFDTNFYAKMRVVAKISGDDMFGDVIRTPIGVARAIVKDETLFAVVHGCRISLFSLRGKLVESLKIGRVTGSDFLLSGDVVSEAEIGTLYLAARSGRSSCIYKVELAPDRRSKSSEGSGNLANSITPVVFVQLKGRISGLALSKSRHELFTIVDDEVHCFSLKDSAQQPFTHKVYQGGSSGHLNAKLQGFIDAKSLLFYTKDAGRELCLFDLATKTEKRLLQKKAANDNTTDIRGAVADPAGNIIVMNRQTNMQVIASGTTDQIIAELNVSPDQKMDLRGIAMFSGGQKSQHPVIAVTDHVASQVILFSV